MTESLSLVLLFFTAALFYGTDTSGGRRRFAAFEPSYRASVARLIATIALVAAARNWYSVESGPAAALFTTVGMMTMATLFALLTPLFPRFMRGATVACVPVILVLAWLRVVS